VDRAGMDYWLHRLAGDPRPAPEIPEEPTAERAVPEDLDRAYRTLLGLLPLSPAHHKALLGRGLDEGAIEEGLYRSLPRTGRAARVMRITEGELKADVAAALSGVLTISVPGVSAWRGALSVLRTLAPARVVLAFDADAATNPHVARAAEATAEALAVEGWEVA